MNTTANPKSKKTKSNKNQRKDKRFVTKLPAYVQDIEEEKPCQVRNISKGGFFINGKKDITETEGVQFRLVLQDSKGSQEILVKGEVTFTVDEKTARKIGVAPGVGVKVIDFPSDYDEEKFKCFISQIECLGTSFALLGPKFDK